MNAMRLGLFCALIGWMAADAQAQLGTYGSPDPIPLGQYAPRDSYVPAMASRTSYVSTDDGSGPTLIPPPPGKIPQPPSESSAVANMLSEPSTAVNPAPGCSVLPSGGYIKDAGKCDTCGDVCCACNGCCSRWYASADALYMGRSQPSKTYTSAEPTANPVNQGYFSDVNWTWGAQATVGYRFGCCCEWAVEATYWGLAESCTDGGPGIPGPYVSPMTFGLTSILNTVGGSPTGTQSGSDYTDGSLNHHIWRNWDAQDVEINFVRPLLGDDCNCFGVDFLAGVRWFRFQDGFVFGAQHAVDGTAYGGDWLYLNDHITNDLVGLQAGCNASYRFADRWKFFVRPMVGVFDNHMTLDYNLYAVGRNNGTLYQGSSLTYTNPNYPVHATSDGFAFLTQVDLGLDWQITRHISTQFGYRVLAMTGMGLSDAQVPFYANDTPSISEIQHNDSLIVHGAFGGLTFTW